MPLLCSTAFFPKNRAVYNMEKYRRARRATDGNMADAHHLPNNRGYKQTLRICNIYRFSAVITVARMCLSVTLYAHCLLYLGKNVLYQANSGTQIRKFKS